MNRKTLLNITDIIFVVLLLVAFQCCTKNKQNNIILSSKENHDPYEVLENVK